MINSFFLYIFLGILPSLIWLCYFLRKDVHPEPKGKILAVFLGGVLAGFLAIFFEIGFEKFISFFDFNLLLKNFLIIFLGVALVEEISKYLVVKVQVLNSPEFDEPVDAMLYLIISALGFAGIENILLFFKPGLFSSPFDPFLFSFLRFLGATFLHALSSAILGYFLALSLRFSKNHLQFLTAGILIATFLHGFYNFTIIEIEGFLKLYLLGILLLLAFIFVILGFKKLKRSRSVCEVI